jgi:hypothetical protein
MSTELLELNQRVERLEFAFDRISEVIDIKVPPRHYSSRSAERGAWLIAKARRNAHKAKEHFDRLFKLWGITEKPIGRKNLQKLYREAGFDENDNQFARGIIEMREE